MIDILLEWKEKLPSSIVDYRVDIPRHSKLLWGKRRLNQIKGICIHQTLGRDDPKATAEYHIENFPRRTALGVKYGAPSLCYTFYIRKSGQICWCNDMEDVTWSQGFAKRPGSENVDFVSIVVGGNFSGPGYKGLEVPTEEQMKSLDELVKWLMLHLNLKETDVFGHFNFGKPACPGYVILKYIELLKNRAVLSDMWKIDVWQRYLVYLGFNIGTGGPNADGVDGVWGRNCRDALIKFQKQNNIPPTGDRDDLTKKLIKDRVDAFLGRR